MVLPFFVSSCSDEDGEGTPMKWKTEVKKSSDDYFHKLPLQLSPVFYCNMPKSKSSASGLRYFSTCALSTQL